MKQSFSLSLHLRSEAEDDIVETGRDSPYMSLKKAGFTTVGNTAREVELTCGGLFDYIEHKWSRSAKIRMNSMIILIISL